MIYNFGIRVWTALTVLWHSRPARILSLYTPDRSQGCRTGGSLISRWSQNRPFCCFSARKWTWLTHPRWWHTHKKNFGCLSEYRHSPKIFLDRFWRPTYLYQSLEQHRERHIADIVFLRPRVCLAVRGKAPSARLSRISHCSGRWVAISKRLCQVFSMAAISTVSGCVIHPDIFFLESRDHELSKKLSKSVHGRLLGNFLKLGILRKNGGNSKFPVENPDFLKLLIA